jgi:hypothetical protein
MYIQRESQDVWRCSYLSIVKAAQRTKCNQYDKKIKIPLQDMSGIQRNELLGTLLSCCMARREREHSQIDAAIPALLHKGFGLQEQHCRGLGDTASVAIIVGRCVTMG